jgi:hypothetical protein
MQESDRIVKAIRERGFPVDYVVCNEKGRPATLVLKIGDQEIPGKRR